MKKTTNTFLLWASLCVAGSAHALTLGSSADRVILGRTLDLSFHIQPDAGHTLDGSCLDVVVFQGQTMMPESKVSTHFEGENTLRVRSSIAVTEPMVTVQLSGGCSGRLQRNYTFLSVLPTQLPADTQTYYPQLQEQQRSARLGDMEPLVAPNTAAANVASTNAGAPNTTLPSGAQPTAMHPTSASAPQATAVASVSARKPSETPAKTPQTPDSSIGQKNLGSVPAPAVPGSTSAALASAAEPDPIHASNPAPAPQATSEAVSQTPATQPDSTAVVQPGADATAEQPTVAASQEGLPEGMRSGDFIQMQRPMQDVVPQQNWDEQPYEDPLMQLIKSPQFLAGAVAGLLALILLLRLRKRALPPKGTVTPSPAAKSLLDTDVSELARAVAQGKRPLKADTPTVSLADVAAAEAASLAAAQRSAPASVQPVAENTATVREALMQTAAMGAATTLQDLPSAEPSDAAAIRTGVVRPQDMARAAEDLVQVQEKAEFFASVGEHDKAVELLEQHLSTHLGASPQAYLDLLHIFFRLSRTDAFERTRQAFERHFNVSVPPLTSFTRRGRDLLGGYPEVLADIEARWPQEQAIATLHELLLRPTDPQAVATAARQAARNKGEPFDLAAFDDLLMLYGVAQLTPAAERGLMQGRQRTTPKEASLPDLMLDGALGAATGVVAANAASAAVVPDSAALIPTIVTVGDEASSTAAPASPAPASESLAALSLLDDDMVGSVQPEASLAAAPSDMPVLDLLASDAPADEPAAQAADEPSAPSQPPVLLDISQAVPDMLADVPEPALQPAVPASVRAPLDLSTLDIPASAPPVPVQPEVLTDAVPNLLPEFDMLSLGSMSGGNTAEPTSQPEPASPPPAAEPEPAAHMPSLDLLNMSGTAAEASRTDDAPAAAPQSLQEQQQDQPLTLLSTEDLADMFASDDASATSGDGTLPIPTVFPDDELGVK